MGEQLGCRVAPTGSWMWGREVGVRNPIAVSMGGSQIVPLARSASGIREDVVDMKIASGSHPLATYAAYAVLGAEQRTECPSVPISAERLSSRADRSLDRFFVVLVVPGPYFADPFRMLFAMLLHPRLLLIGSLGVVVAVPRLDLFRVLSVPFSGGSPNLVAIRFPVRRDTGQDRFPVRHVASVSTFLLTFLFAWEWLVDEAEAVLSVHLDHGGR